MERPKNLHVTRKEFDHRIEKFDKALAKIQKIHPELTNDLIDIANGFNFILNHVDWSYYPEYCEVDVNVNSDDIIS